MLAARLKSLRLDRLLVVRDDPSGLFALLAIDDTRLGPAAGGIRTRTYADEWEALTDAAALARAMTYKCALAQLPCGGGKCVVMEHPGLDRPRAFAALGRAIEDLGGLFRTAGDYGTRAEDLTVLARNTQYVSLPSRAIDLDGATARGVMRAIEAALEHLGHAGIAGARVLVQGAGAVGSRLIEQLVARGADVSVSDPDHVHREAAIKLGAKAVPHENAISTECDVLAPCALGHVIDESTVPHLRCRVICGAANNPLANDRIADHLAARENSILYVPDFVASAGAVIEGIGHSMLGLASRTARVDAIYETTKTVLANATAMEVSTVLAARMIAEARLSEPRRTTARPPAM